MRIIRCLPGRAQPKTSQATSTSTMIPTIHQTVPREPAAVGGCTVAPIARSLPGSPARAEAASLADAAPATAAPAAALPEPAAPKVAAPVAAPASAAPASAERSVPVLPAVPSGAGRSVATPPVAGAVAGAVPGEVAGAVATAGAARSEEHTSELQS